MYTTRPFYGCVNKTKLMICDCLDIQRIPAFAIKVVRGIFRWLFYCDVCPIYSPKTLWQTMFFKSKEQDSLTTSSVRGSLMYLLAVWFKIAFVTCRMIIDTILSNSTCICSFSKLLLARKMIHCNSNFHLHRNRFLKSFCVLADVLTKFFTYDKKRLLWHTKVFFLFISYHFIVEKLKPTLFCTSRANPTFSFFPFTLFIFSRNKFITKHKLRCLSVLLFKILRTSMLHD